MNPFSGDPALYPAIIGKSRDAAFARLMGAICGSLHINAKSAADAVKAGVGRFLEGVLPDADDFPSLPAELAGDALIAGHVVFAFFIPELPVGFRAGVALGATVPETSVDKDGNF